MKFESAVDRWYYLVIVAMVVLLVATFVRMRSGEVPVAVAMLTVLPAGLPVWILFSTYYQVSDDLLLVRTGPFRWRIKLAEIHSAAPSRSIISSPALSLNRIKLRYGKNKSVLVSPKDRAGFLMAIGHAD